MAKTRISEYSTTNSSNTDINSINIDEGCAPSGINNAIREVMVHLKNWQTNASGDGATFASLVVQGTGSFTGAVTMSAGATLSGTNTLSGSNIISGNINSSGTTNTFSGGNILSGTNTLSGTNIISGNINSSGTNTFSGTSVLSGANTISLAAGSASAPSLLAKGDTNTGIWFPAADTLAASTGGSERLRIDSSGNVGIGTTNPTIAIDVSRTSGATQLKLTNTGSASTNKYTALFQGSSSTGLSDWDESGVLEATSTGGLYLGAYAGPIRFYTGNVGRTERMRIDSSGNVLVGKTSATENGGVLQVSNGITFPASQNGTTDANTLDDYEEGTWTPIDTSGAGLSFTVATGFYTKIGRLVVASGQVQWPSTANGVSAAVSLPFTSSSAAGNYSAGSGMNSANLTLASFVTSNASYVSFYKQPLGTFTQATNANLSGQYIYFTVTFFTA